ncbi:MAG: VWA domain-containing protein [Prevotellaceae bacterium]|jgi:hypothetical protein|nr:VWA domain-containing protein [Prevotellaceae bacterium]
MEANKMIGSENQKNSYLKKTDGNVPISLSRLLRCHLHVILCNMKDSKSKFEIITFADDVRDSIFFDNFSCENIITASSKVNSIEINGKNTIFSSVFKHVKRQIAHEKPYSRFSPPKQHTLVFLSDFIPNKKDLPSIDSVIHDLSNRNIYLNVIGIDSKTVKTKPPLIQEKIQQILKPNRYKIINILEDNISIELPSQVSENHFPFYYTNHIYERSLVSNLTFNNIKDKTYGFSLQQEDGAMRDFTIGDSSNSYALSEQVKEFPIKEGDILPITMRGHISTPFSSEIIISDLAEKRTHRIGIIFYKKFPMSGKILIVIMISMSFGVGILVYRYLKRGGREIIIRYLKKR